MQRRRLLGDRRKFRRARQLVPVGVGLALVATGCYGPFSLDPGPSADVAWVVPVTTGEPPISHLELWSPDATEPAATGPDGATTWWLAGDLNDDTAFELLTAGADGTWHGRDGSVTFPPSAAPPTGTSAPFALQLDEDKTSELAWYHDGNGTWEVQDRGIVTFGVADDGAGDPDHDVPVPADYDGDGFDELAVYRPTDGTWWTEGVVDPLPVGATLGLGFPAPADYDGDGDDDPAVLHLLTGELRIAGQPSVQLDPDAVPAPADYDGDGAAEAASVTTDPATGERVLRIDGLGEHRRAGDGAGGPQPWTVRPGTLDRYADLLSLSSQALRTAGQGNFLGTGRLGYSATAGSPYRPENMTLSINGYCTDKIQGDRFAAGFVGTEGCQGSGVNVERRVPNYTYEVVLPEGRTYDTDVLVFDGAYIPSGRDDGDLALEAGELPPTSLFPADFNPGGGTGATGGEMRTTFQLFAADATPDDPTDDMAMDATGGCAPSDPDATGTKTFLPPSSFGGGTAGAAAAISDETNTSFSPTHTGAAFYNVSVGWWNLCRIPASAPAGHYRLTVDADGPSPLTRGSNNFALVANRVGATGLCHEADDATCPTIVGAPDLSLRASASATIAQFGLVELAAQPHARTLRVELWDPAEGSQALRILQPTGPGTWSAATFDWRSTNGASGSATTFVPVASNNFNGQLVTIDVPLPAGWSPPGGNELWKLEYQFVSGTVTDRVTISALLTGPPAP